MGSLTLTPLTTPPSQGRGGPAAEAPSPGSLLTFQRSSRHVRGSPPSQNRVAPVTPGPRGGPGPLTPNVVVPLSQIEFIRRTAGSPMETRLGDEREVLLTEATLETSGPFTLTTSM